MLSVYLWNALLTLWSSSPEIAEILQLADVVS
jgi:hypothetical protein